MTRWLAAARADDATRREGVLSVASVSSGGSENRNRQTVSTDVAAPAIVSTTQDPWAEIYAPGWSDHLRSIAFMEAPPGISEKAWRSGLSAVAAFSVEHAACLYVAGGWRADALFHRPEHWARLDQRGDGWLLADAVQGGGRLIRVEEDQIRFGNARGAFFTIRRRVATPPG